MPNLKLKTALLVLSLLLSLLPVVAWANQDTTYLNLTIEGSNTVDVFAGDGINNNDICTADQIAQGATVDTTRWGEAPSSVTCTSAESTLTLGALQASANRQFVSGVMHDIVFEDLRGFESPQYTLTMTISDFVDTQDSSKAIRLGSNPDNLLDGNNNPVPLRTIINPSAAVIQGLKPEAVTSSENLSKYQRGASQTVITPTEPITILQTNGGVVPGRMEIDGVQIDIEIPGNPELGDFQGTIIQTLI